MSGFGLLRRGVLGRVRHTLWHTSKSWAALFFRLAQPEQVNACIAGMVRNARSFTSSQHLEQRRSP
jgi:hypothetical protein